VDRIGKRQHVRGSEPANADEVVARYQASTRDDVETAIDAAVAAQDDWAGTPGPSRGQILKEAGKRLDARKDDVTETLVREEGKTRSEAAGEVQRAIDIFYYYAEKARDIGGTSKAPSASERNSTQSANRSGTVGLITPWNYPIAIPAWKLAPALATGNTLVIKPGHPGAEYDASYFRMPRRRGTARRRRKLRDGIRQRGRSPLASHDDIDSVSFTGSTSVGTAVAQSAADDLKRVQCEMGGKNPTVVMPSADVDEAVDIVGVGRSEPRASRVPPALERSSTKRSTTSSSTRSATTRNHSRSGRGSMIPIWARTSVNRELESTLEYVDIAREDGATLQTGGSEVDGGAFDDGYYVEPTVFSDVESEMRIAQEEVFGPVLAVLKVSDFEEGVEVANDVEFGLSASIVTQDLTEANRFVDDVEAGVAKVNEKRRDSNSTSRSAATRTRRRTRTGNRATPQSISSPARKPST